MSNQYTDHTGVVRNLGSLPIPEGFVSSFPPYGSEPEQPFFSEDEIKQIITAPDRVDREVLIPFDKYGTQQWSTSACNGHAGAGGVTSIRVMSGKDDGFVGSGAFLYSKINGGRDAGSNLEDGMRQLTTGGVCSQETVPYDKIFPSMYPKSADEEAADHKLIAAYRAKTIQGWESGLAAGHMGVCAVMAGKNFDKFTDGVAGVVNGPANHAVLCEDIRWRNGEFQYLMRNSWGINWGRKGRIWITRAHIRQTIGSHCFYLIPSTQDV